MKKIAKITIVLIYISLISCSTDKDEPIIDQNNLSIEEENDLKFSREEEKLARDVYLFSYEKYGDVIFNNIAQSEQQHMDQILILLNKYQMTDPASSDKGLFTDQELQVLYDQLTSKASISLNEALEVGAIIEDLDIFDLNELESRTIKPDLLSVYEKLECGSRNHLRSFISRLEANNVQYNPEYISLSAFNEIINGTKEQCGR